jgi:MYXO-CTERM domain-containing protein
VAATAQHRADAIHHKDTCMKIHRTLRPLLIAAALAANLTGTAHAGVISATVSVNDRFAAYVGAADGSGLSYVGSFLGNGPNWFTGNTFTNVSAAAGSYLYVMAWGIANNEGSPALQAAVTTLNGSVVYSDAAHWQGIHRPQPYAGFAQGITDAMPSTSALAQEIGAANWAQDVVVEAPLNTMWDVIGGGVAQHIWVNSFTTGVMDGSYAVFRLALDVPGEPTGTVAEPYSAALALMGLLVAGASRRRAAPARS